eukprot:264292-Rhodomonas_salina.1
MSAARALVQHVSVISAAPSKTKLEKRLTSAVALDVVPSEIEVCEEVVGCDHVAERCRSVVEQRLLRVVVGEREECEVVGLGHRVCDQRDCIVAELRTPRKAANPGIKESVKTSITGKQSR